jgi:hypothetical protein
MADPAQVVITVEEPEGPARRGFDGAAELRRELEKLGGAATGPDRPQTRMIDPAAIGQIVVSLSGVAGGVGAVVETVRTWLQSRAAQRTVRMEIDGDVLEMTGLDDAAQQALIDGWLERHRKPA